MTKGECTAIIEHSKVGCLDNKNIYRLEVYAEIVISPEFPQSGSGLACSKKTSMEKKYIDLAQATYYLIQLFYQTGQKYSCTRTKLGKLLSIAAFYYARKNQILFKESICKYDGCGTTIKELSFIVDRDVYIRYSYSDSKSDISTNEIDETLFVPEKFTQVERLSDEIKDALKNVFIKFGAYNAVELGRALNIIVQHSDVSDVNGKINLCVISQLDQNEFSPQGSFDAKLMDFLFAHMTEEAP